MMKNMQKSEYIKDSASRLCENRCSYNFRESIEEEIVCRIRQRNELPELIHEIVSLLHGQDGNIRVGAAEILGAITPPSMAEMVRGELKRHLNDDFVRDFVYGVAQGDEEDLRTVSDCCRLSIDKLAS
jgi:hypothetical protein